MSERRSITDFGNILSSDFDESIDVDSIEEVSEVYLKGGSSVIPVGSRHTMMGQTLSRTRAPLKRTGSDLISVTGDVVTVSSHTKISDIDSKLSSLGLEVPTSPDHRDLTIGGVLSVGGYDPMSVRRGGLVDSVESLSAVDTSGKIIEGNLSEMLCAQGTRGFIWDVNIRAARATRDVFVTGLDINHHEYCKSIPELIRDDDTTGFHFTTGANQSRLEIIKTCSGDVQIEDFRKHRKKVTDDWVFQDAASVFRPWSDSFVPVERSAEFFDFCISRASKWGLPENMWSLFSIVCKSGKHSHFPHSIGFDYSVGVGLYVNIPTCMRSKMISVVESQFEISDYVSSIGGKSCLHGWKRPERLCGSTYETLKLLGM